MHSFGWVLAAAVWLGLGAARTAADQPGAAPRKPALPLSTAPASSPPTFQKGQSYDEVRRELLRLGWKPVVTRYRDGAGEIAKYEGDASLMLKAGFIETFACSGVEANLCSFVWRKGRHCVVVRTAGERLGDPMSPWFEQYVPGRCRGPDDWFR